MDLSGPLRAQSEACLELGSPMYGELLALCAEDADAGGPVAEVLDGHESDPGPSALGLRLMGSVHRLVLERRAGTLAAFYPSVGGTWEAAGGWRAFTTLLSERPDAVREWLDRPPQTNEVGRAAALYGGLLQLPRALPIRLFEIGSSAGLNLRADHLTYVDQDRRRFGSAADDLVLDPAWTGRRLDGPAPRIEERLGSDLSPVDATTTEGRVLLTAYVWPDQRVRLERLRFPVTVRRQGAGSFVTDLAAGPGGGLREGTTTVLWHSVMWQYLSPQERAAVSDGVDRWGEAATDARPFAHLRAEPSRRAAGAPHEFLVRLRTWPGGEDRLLGSTVAHGVPTLWE
jgi:hypothetical protein